MTGKDLKMSPEEKAPGTDSRVPFLAWAWAVVMLVLFVISLSGVLLPLRYGFLALGVAIASGYLALQLRRLGREVPLEASREDPPFRSPRLLIETVVVTAATLVAVFEAESLVVVLLVYLAGMAAVVLFEGALMMRRVR